MSVLARENKMCCYDRHDQGQEEITTLECDENIQNWNIPYKCGCEP